MHSFNHFGRAGHSLKLALALALSIFFAATSFATPPAGINVKANVATTANTSGFGSSFSSMSITGVTTASRANSGIDLKASNVWTGVGYTVTNGDAGGSFRGTLDASAFVNKAQTSDYCDPVTLSADAFSTAAINMNGGPGQGGFTAIDSTAAVKGSVIRSSTDGVSVLTAKVDVLSGKTTVVSQPVTVDGVVLQAPTLHTASGDAAASFLLDAPVFDNHED